jgi:hypothetical protein
MYLYHGRANAFCTYENGLLSMLPKPENPDSVLFSGDIPQKTSNSRILRSKLCTQQPLVLIQDLRDFRISVFNYNVSGLGRKVIIR